VLPLIGSAEVGAKSCAWHANTSRSIRTNQTSIRLAVVAHAPNPEYGALRYAAIPIDGHHVLAPNTYLNTIAAVGIRNIGSRFGREPSDGH
jgi:hypothetical protein